MPWAKLDDQFGFNPKVIAAGKDGKLAYVMALTYSASQLTDGFIQDAALPMIAVMAETEDMQTTAARLVKVGLWERVEGGYVIHDYLDYNPSAEETKTKREAAARRQAEWRAKHRDKGNGRYASESNAVSNGVTNASRNTAPSPSPSPSPSTAAAPRAREESLMSTLDAHGVMASEAAYGQRSALWEKYQNPRLFDATLEHIVGTGKHPTVNYARAILERCARDGCAPGEFPDRSNGHPPARASPQPKRKKRRVKGTNPLTGEEFTTEL